jgi:2-polyprenyl-3-methyl-5-hydroxy-6-metoxy-1,4-benzoquinol methylase
MTVRPFSRLDNVGADQRRHAFSYLDAAAGHPEIQRVRSVAMEMLAPSPGERLLEAGCGTGEVARQLASWVGSTGSVTAMDLSAQAIEVARSRDVGLSVTYAVGDVMALEYGNGHFDGVRCERVLQWVDDPDAAIRELARVTRPGGRICVIDTGDLKAASWDGFDHAEEVIAEVDAAAGNRTSGRTIRSRMVRAGLQQTTTLPVTLRFLSPEDAAVVLPHFNDAYMRERLPGELRAQFNASVARAAARGDFLFAFTMWISVGRVSG